MKLISCHIENFGRLRDFDYIFDDGVNVLFAENGWGKSTFAAFLCAMFYGLPGSGRGASAGGRGSSAGGRGISAAGRPGSERVRYLPWQGGICGGQMVFEAGGREYLMTRVFGKRASEDEFELRDAATNLPSFDFSEKTGEELFHLDRESFLRTVFTAQQDCETRATDDVNALIGDLQEQAGDMGSCEEALRRLRDAANRLSPGRQTGRMYRRAAQIEELSQQAGGEEELEERLDRSRAMLERQRQRKKQIDRELREAGGKLEKAEADLDEAKRALSEMEERGRVPQSRGEASPDGPGRIRPERGPQKERRRRQDGTWGGMRLPAMIIAGIALLSAGVSSFIFAAYPAGAALSAAGVLLACTGAFFFKRMYSATFYSDAAGGFGISEDEGGGSFSAAVPDPGPDAAPGRSLNAAPGLNPDAEQDPGLDRYSGLNAGAGLDRDSESRSGPDRYSGLNKAPYSDSDPDFEQDPVDLRNEEGRISQRLLRCQALVLELRQEIQEILEAELSCRMALSELGEEAEEIEEEIEACREAGKRLKALREEQEEDGRRCRQIGMAAAFLQEAREAMTARYADPIRKSFCGCWERIAGRSAAGIRVDANSSVTIQEMGKQRDFSLLSTGYRDLAGFCLRAALADAMYPPSRGERPPLFLDDPFTNLDDEKLEGALRFLGELGRKYQILYMTCSRARCGALKAPRTDPDL